MSSVDNEIAVESRGTKGTTGKMEQTGNAAVDKTKEGLSKTGEVITDGWITGRIHSRCHGRLGW